MTYVYQCDSPTCRPDWDKQTGGKGHKTSCCHKCDNPECADHKGGCDCKFDSHMDPEHLIEIYKKKIAEGWVPPEIEVFEEGRDGKESSKGS